MQPKASCLTTFTAAQPSETVRDKPAGIARCDTQAPDRWAADRHRFPPYQYKHENLLWHSRKAPRTPSVAERALPRFSPWLHSQRAAKGRCERESTKSGRYPFDVVGEYLGHRRCSLPAASTPPPFRALRDRVIASTPFQSVASRSFQRICWLGIRSGRALSVILRARGAGWFRGCSPCCLARGVTS